MDRLGSGSLIPFSRSVVLSKIVRLLFAIAYASHCSISITLSCVSAIVYTSMACFTFKCTFMDSCSSFATMFSSLASFYTICASTKCLFSALSSSDSSMHTRSTNVALGLVYFLVHQHCLLLRKNSIVDVPVAFVL
jgi:hypothetical protein